MRRDDYVLMIAAGLLRLNGQAFDKAVTYFEQGFELREIRKPGVISMGGTAIDGTDQGLTAWLKSLQAESVCDVFFGWNDLPQNGLLAPHLAAAFAGTQQLLMHVVTKSQQRSYLLRTIFSPQYEITTDQFVEVIDAQSQLKILWDRIADMILESNQMNGREVFDRSEIKQHLQSAGLSTYDFMLGQILQEVQVECAIVGSPFRIPPKFTSLFVKSDFPFGDDNRETVFLYPLREVSPLELLALVSAQPFHEGIWERYVLEADSFSTTLPTHPANAWPSALGALSKEDLATVTNIICRVICLECEERRVQRVIPAALADAFGPDEIDHQRAQVRSRAGNDRWYLESNHHPWEAYFLSEISLISDVKNQNSDAKITFLSALNRITTFARKIESPFAEAFALATFLLSTKFPSGTFDEGHGQEIQKTLKAKDFSEQAALHFQNVIQYAPDMLVLGFPDMKIRSLLAISIADVFGGMGSWNDQIIEHDHETYQSVSAELFEALKQFFAETLSR
jgi:hypothetical protein